MTSGDWSWARPAWDEHFASLREAGYELERLASAQVYWALHERELRDHFPPEVFFSLAGLRSAHERDGQTRLAATRNNTALEDFAAVRSGGRVIAQFCGEQSQDGVYRMWHTNVHREHRRKGIYSRILQGTIGYTRALGFDAISSEHAPSNNAVIIAKLRAGFRVYGLEIAPAAGLSLLLRYFHNPEHLAVYEFRCGNASLSPHVAAHGAGAFTQLRTQLAKTAEA